jgi:hypothetical protein
MTLTTSIQSQVAGRAPVGSGATQRVRAEIEIDGELESAGRRRDLAEKPGLPRSLATSKSMARRQSGEFDSTLKQKLVAREATLGYNGM